MLLLFIVCINYLVFPRSDQDIILRLKMQVACTLGECYFLQKLYRCEIALISEEAKEQDGEGGWKCDIDCVRGLHTRKTAYQCDDPGSDTAGNYDGAKLPTREAFPQVVLVFCEEILVDIDYHYCPFYLKLKARLINPSAPFTALVIKNIFIIENKTDAEPENIPRIVPSVSV